MKKIIFFLSIITFTSCEVQKLAVSEVNNLQPITLYETTSDYLLKKPMQVNAGILIKNQSNQHITIKGVYDLKSGIKVKGGSSAWAFEYKGNHYFNLGYSSDVNNWYSYAKLDIDGKYCAVIIDNNSPNVLLTTSTNYGGGLAGALAVESIKWNKNWKDKNGNKKKILFIDTNMISAKIFNRNTGSLGDYLTRSQLKNLMIKLNIPISDEKIKDIEFERVIEIIEIANKG